MATRRYRPNLGAINQMLHGRNGPVVLHLANLGRAAEGHARRLVGVKSGATRASITSRIVRSSPGYNVEISATSEAMPWHHIRTRPHVIRPRNAKVLRFKVGGRTVYATKVNHPGFRGNPFLIEASRMAGFRVRKR